MNIVTFALRRPVTLLVLILAMGLAAFAAVLKMPRDIFPDLGVPVIYIAQPYGGMDPTQMEGFIVNYYEYHFLYISGVEHIESKSIQGVALMKLQFHPGTDMAHAMAETVAEVDRSRSSMPPGTVAPFIIRFDAGSVPVGNLVFSSDTHPTNEILDLAMFRVRPLFATLPGLSAPPPFGASARTIVIHADPEKLRSYNMTPDEVVAALSASNTITPSGNALIGDNFPVVRSNSTVSDIQELANVMIRPGSLRTVYLRDVATVEDGSDLTTGYALVNGKRTVYIPVTKRSDASTLAVVDLVKSNIPKFQSMLPDDIKVSYEFDQSPYVTRAIFGLLSEGALGAVLTGFMVLLFLWDFKSAVIVVLNIPVAIMAALLALWLCGQTVNMMTLGGLALAVGILVDEATVTIENIHTHLALGKSSALAAYDATTETTLPRLLAMLCILAVFMPSFFMEGSTRALFVPLSMGVGFSMIASYFLSSTFVPIMSSWFLKHHEGETHNKEGLFPKVARLYGHAATRMVQFRYLFVPVYLVAALGLVVWVGPILGTEIFPHVDSGQFQLRMHAPTGTNIDRTEQYALQTLEIIKKEVGPENVAVTLGYVGNQPPNYPVNTIHVWTSGPEEAVMQIQIKQEAGIRVLELEERLRKTLAKEMPDVSFSFEPSDIVSRIMSFGSLTPVEVAVSGPDSKANVDFANKIKDKLAAIPSLRDLRILQSVDYPTIRINVDRERAGALGMTSSQINRSFVAATSSSRYVVPNFWADSKSGVGYQVQVEVPQEKLDSVDQIKNLPVGTNNGGQVLLRNVATISNRDSVEEIDRYNMQRMITVGANISGEDLGRVSAHIRSALAELGTPPPRVSVAVRGQTAPMDQMLGGLETGFLLAIVVIFLLLTANFQSLKLAFTVVSTVPAVAAGVVTSLYLSHTTLNIQSFMGAIMSIGVAVANAILLITFAERTRLAGEDSALAAIQGATSRLRPILMTSAAMIAGMIPMALGLGEGGEQTAPLGRAVVGGLLFATFATLTVLPSVYALVMHGASRKSPSLDPHDAESARYLPNGSAKVVPAH